MLYKHLPAIDPSATSPAFEFRNRGHKVSRICAPVRKATYRVSKSAHSGQRVEDRSSSSSGGRGESPSEVGLSMRVCPSSELSLPARSINTHPFFEQKTHHYSLPCLIIPRAAQQQPSVSPYPAATCIPSISGPNPQNYSKPQTTSQSSLPPPKRISNHVVYR